MDNNNFLNENKKLIILAIFAIVFLSIPIFLKTEKENTNLKVEQIIQRKVFDYKSVLDTIEAKSYYVYDLVDMKSIFSKEEHLKLPLASITKIMSGLVVMDIMPDTTTVIISQDNLLSEGDSGLYVGEKWKLKDLLDFSLISSSNDGMSAVASTLNQYLKINNKDIVKVMNEKAKEFGLDDTIFMNETGLDIDANLGGAYSSAFDTAVLLKNVMKIHPELVVNTNKVDEKYISESNLKHTATNTNTSINKINNLIISKTGYTDLAGGNLAVVVDAGFMHPVAIVVLGSSIDGRFNDVVKLTKLTLEKLSE